MNTLTVFTYLVTYHPNEVIELTQTYKRMNLTISSVEMSWQEMEDLSKQLDHIRIDGSKMSSRSLDSSLDGKTITIKTLEVDWDYE